MSEKLLTFWMWFLRGSGSKPGYRRVINSWLIFHFIIGLIVNFVILLNVSDVAKSALLPMLAVFIGLTFSWAGNAHSLLQSSEIIEKANENPGGIYEYVYTFQLCILIMLITIALWTSAMLEPKALINDNYLNEFNFFATVFLYAFASLSLRTCWHAVVGTNMLLLWKAKSTKS